MSRSKRIVPFWVLMAAVFVVIFIVGLIAQHYYVEKRPFASAIDSTLLDWRQWSLGQQELPEEIIIVAIDDDTLAAEADPMPTVRARLADVLNAISQAKPKALAVDVLLADKALEQDDQRLAKTLAQTPTFIAAAARFSSEVVTAALPKAESVFWPQALFQDVAKTGLVNIVTSSNGVPRQAPTLVLTDKGVIPTLPLQVAAHHLETEPKFENDALVLGEGTIALNVGHYLPIRFAGASETVPTISARDVLSGGTNERLTGKTVFVGMTATAVGDRFRTPFDASMPGVELLATITHQFLGHLTLKKTDQTRLADVLLLAAFSLVLVLVLLSTRLSLGLPIALGAVVIWLLVTWAGFSFGYWLNAGIPVSLGMALILFLGAMQYFFERLERRRAGDTISAFKQLQPSLLAEKIEQNPQFLKQAEERDLVVLFVDLSGFTKISEELGPANTQTFLKRFHSVTNTVVEIHNGVVLSYMGDGAMAVFGLDDQHNRQQSDSILCASALVAAIAKLEIHASIDAQLACRVGVHSGPVVLSRLGADTNQQVSVTGDTVNVASRLMEIAKDEKSSMAISGRVMDGHFKIIRNADFIKDSVPVRGRAGTLSVHFWLDEG